MGGVKIGSRAVVGAGSVVNMDVGAGEVVVGVPARIVRRKGERSRTERTQRRQGRQGWQVMGYRLEVSLTDCLAA